MFFDNDLGLNKPYRRPDPFTVPGLIPIPSIPLLKPVQFNPVSPFSYGSQVMNQVMPMPPIMPRPPCFGPFG